MSFLWSPLLVLLSIIPFIVVAYILLLRRRRKFAVRYSSLSLVREAASHQTWLRRHLPFALFLLALTSLILALGRPVATVTVPSNQATIILAIDVSRSMCATDISPNRLEVAKDAAQAFVQNHRSGRQIGIVAFAGFAELVQPPTTDTRALHSAIENLTTARRTAIGSAILRSIDALAEVDDRIAPSDNVSASSGIFELPPSEVELSPHIIVLLTDGSSNAGPFPLTAAAQAVSRGIRVYTIGYGTVNNTSPMDCGDSFGDQFGFGWGGSQWNQQNFRDFRLQLDETTLKQIADMTGGAYYAATSADELEEVFQNLPSYVIVTRETIEVSVFFTAFATLMILLAMALSFRWHPLG
ncbi:MAG: VWA domain-containing protein [Anaerolineales bacterium]|nr:VWA domain-containing protein [Anaerolineales bacterium]NUQ84418.1 VWA domain-containing protein [Anaerolineales bacterium]